MAQNIEMQCKQSDGSYETLLPKSQASLLEINNTDLGNYLGGNTTVEGSLDYLSRMYAYWWKRDIITPVYGLKWTQISVTYPKLQKYSWTTSYPYTGTYSYQCGNILTVDASGNIQRGTDWITLNITVTGDGSNDWRVDESPDPRNYRRNYIYFEGKYYAGAEVRGTPDTSTILIATSNDSTGYWVYISSNTGDCYEITSTLDHNEYVTDYVYSFSRDAYPDSGTVGNYTYTYLGIPFENAMKDGPK